MEHRSGEEGEENDASQGGVMTHPPDEFARRLRQVARLLRWSVGTMVVAFGVAWLPATQRAPWLLRIAVLAGAVGFFGATLCFVWLGYQAVVRRRRAPRP